MSDTTEVILARIETKLDAALSDLADHETRIRKLERNMWAFAGGATIVGAAFGAGISLFLHFLP